MAGLVIPLGLDTSGFEKALKRSEKQVENMVKFLDSPRAKTMDINTNTKALSKAKQDMEGMLGTGAKLRMAMKTIEEASENINLKTKSGQKQLVKNYDEWVKIRQATGDATMSFERLYKLQQEYLKLTGKKYEIKTLADAKGLSDAVQRAKEYNRELERTKRNKEQLSQISGDLMKKFGAMFSLDVIRNFTMSVINVGGELEKQRIALGSIVGDISKANILFSQLKQQALESPFTFKHIIAGTRQLAAFNIEAEKLYDTQYMLSELSAGLGVDVSRLILAYGQVRAAAVLRGQELRQFTEAGIPIIDALAKKFTELEGRVVSTGEVFEKVSERLVPFKMVHEVLSDMTQEGGMFFGMQAKMADTVAGQWLNVSDAIDQMYMDIAQQNSGLIISTIKLFRELIANWRIVEKGMYAVAIAYAGYIIVSIAHQRKVLAGQVAQNKLLMTEISLIKMKKAAMLGFIGIAAMGLTMLIGYLWQMSQEASRYKRVMDEIAGRHSQSVNTESQELEKLIGQLKSATEGTEEYKRIKDKISSQYGEYMPMLIDEKTKVDDIAKAYGYATSAMKAHYSEKALEEMKAKMGEDKGIARADKETTKDVRNVLLGQGISDAEAERIANRYMAKVKEMVQAGEKIEDTFALLQQVAAEFAQNVTASGYSTVAGANMNFDSYIRNTVDLFTTKWGNAFKAIEQSHNAQFNGLAEFIEAGLNEVDKVYKTGLSEIETQTKFSPLANILRKQDVEKRKEAADIVAQEMQAILVEMAKKNIPVTQETKKWMTDLIGSAFDDGEVVIQSLDPKIQEIARLANEKVQQAFDKMPLKKTTIVSRVIEDYFIELNKKIQKERSALTANDKETAESLKVKEDAAKTIHNLTSEYVSLTNAMSLFDQLKTNRETLRQNEDFAEGLRIKLAGLTEGTKQYSGAHRDLNIQLKEVEKWKNSIVIIEQLIRALGIKEEGNNKPQGENPEIERANRLVRIYKELNQSYEKYSEYKDAEFARQQSMTEFQVQYNELRKELGNRIPELTAIKSQSDLIKALESTLNSRAFVTKKGRSILQRALIGEQGGELVDDAKKSFEKIKGDADQLLDKIIVGVNTEKILEQVDAIITELNNMGIRGREMALELRVRVNKEKVKSDLKKIDDELELAKNRYALGEEFTSMEEQFGFKMPLMFQKSIISYEKYIETLRVIRSQYLAMGDAGDEKVAEIDMFITKERFDNIKAMYQEALKLEYEQLDNEKKAHLLQELIDNKGATLREVSIKLANLSTQDAGNTIIEELKAKIRLLMAEIGAIQKQKDALTDDVFRTSDIYNRLYGDIEQWGTDAYSAILKSIEKALNVAKVLNKGASNETWILIDPNTGKEITVTAKEYSKAVNDVEKAQRKLKTSNPWGKIREEIKKIKDEVTIDGKTENIFNIENLGNAIKMIGDEVKNLGDIGAALGLSEQTQDYVNGISGGITSIGRLIASKGTDLGAWVDLMKNFMLVMDADNKERIRARERQIEILERRLEKLKEDISEVAGVEGYNENITEQLKNLDSRIHAHRQNARDSARSKGWATQQEIDFRKEQDEKIRQLEEERLEVIKSVIAEFSTTLQDAAQSFADAWVDAFLEVGDGFSSFEDSFQKMLRSIAAKQIQQAYISVALKPLIDQLNAAVDPTKEGGIMITANEIRAITEAKQISKNLMESYGSAINDLLRSLGLGEGAFDYDTLQKGIQGITENTAQIIASYMNSVRLEVTNIRMMMQKKSGGTTGVDPMAKMSEAVLIYYPQYLENLIAIREHTSYLKDAYNPTIRGFRMA